MVKIKAKELILAGLVAIAAEATASAPDPNLVQQRPFSFDTPAEKPDDGDHYTFEWPIKDVAIIGAGVSGLLAYRSLAQSGNFDNIRLFERDDVPGGNWHYTDEVHNSVPIVNGSRDDWWKGDYTPTQPESLPFKQVYRLNDDKDREEIEWKIKDHRSPKPVWESLRANTPAPQQQIPEFEWPPHVPWETHQSSLAKYLRSFASWLGINTNDKSPNVAYNTRVESVTKRFVDGKHHGWNLVLRKFEEVKQGEFEESWWSETADAILVASGRFNVPWIPPIDGLAEWQQQFPDRVVHSRQFRQAEAYKGQNVVVIGASASATEIARDINLDANTAYLSIREPTDKRRPDRRPFFLARVPDNTTLIGEIKRFHPLKEGQTIDQGTIELLNGTKITGIDTFIFGTGYRYAFPYLNQYHNSSDTKEAQEARESGEHPIITDGTHVRSLFLDVFYIDQPTIAFQGLNVGIQTFVYGKYTSAAIASVWSGHAKLPSKSKQWAFFWKTVEERGGLKKGFQWLTGEANSRYLRYFVAWLNDASIHTGGDLINVPPEVSEEMKLWQKARQVKNEDVIPFESYSTKGPKGQNGWPKAWKQGVEEVSNEDWSKAVLDDW